MMMASCDKCDVCAPAQHNGTKWIKPFGWFETIPINEPPILCCSRECMDAALRGRAFLRERGIPIGKLEVAPFSDEQIARMLLKERGRIVNRNSLDRILAQPDLVHLKRLQLTLEIVTKKKAASHAKTL